MMRRHSYGILAIALLAGLGSGLAPRVALAAQGPLPQPIPLFEQFLSGLANPNIAYVLFVLGLLGLMGELITPGAIFPGTAGTICLVLGLIGLGQLPTNWGGAALIVAAVVMFLLDIHVPGHGLSIGGAVAFALGSVLLFTPFWIVRPIAENVVRLNPWLVLGMTAGVVAFFVFSAAVGLRAQGRPLAVGRETLAGKVGTVRRALDPAGIVHLEGEEWSATAVDGCTIAAGTSVRVVSSDGLTLRVEPVAPDVAWAELGQ